MKANLKRTASGSKQTLGELEVTDNDQLIFSCKTLEKPWKDNATNISCIPAGEYAVRKHTSPHFGACFQVLNVPGRSEILIHPGNYYTDSKGCILPGETFKDINADGIKDVQDSGKTLKKLLELLPDQFTLTIQ